MNASTTVLRSLGLVAVIALPSLVAAHTKQGTHPVSHVTTPSKDARIIKFFIATDGSLRIDYTDETEARIPLESGRESVTQDGFSDIQVANDRVHIGWLADYMMCEQNYPCSMELVIYRSGNKPIYVDPPFGIPRRWKFLAGGKQVALEYGFPHEDDTGAYVLYDTNTGRELAKFSPESKNSPRWVRQLRASSN